MQNRQDRPNREIWLTVALAAVVLLVGGLAQLMAGRTDGPQASTVAFSRVMTANRDACYPVNGACYDWVELANPGEADVSLRGWRLSDDIDLRGAYVFGDVAVPAGGTLLVYCARRPEDAPEGAIFTGFSLDSEGELLLLADPAERLVETLTVPTLKPNWVYRRDASGEWVQEPAQPEGGAAAEPDPSPLEISEVMAANHSTLADADGDYSDWIELHNAGDAAIDLAGYCLSDTEGKSRWPFPALALSPNEYLVVFASGKNRRDPAGELHANFSLSASDGAVHLYDAGGREVSRLACDNDEADVSVSRDGQGGVTVLWPATPGYHNSEDGMPDALPMLTQNFLGLYINELMDVDGGADWVELYNSGLSELDLSGMGLSDNPARPRKWQFPLGTRIPAGGCLHVALSGADAATTAAYTADFGLTPGETLCLSMADGTIIDRVKLYAQPVGTSYGRAPEQPRYRYFLLPTPGAPNAGQSYAAQTAKVAFSQPGGLHDAQSLTVTLSSQEGASIHYTLDGSQPTAASALYLAPLTLTSSCTVRAVALHDDMLPSAGTAATYILGDRHDGVYTVCVSGDYEALIGPAGALNTGSKRDDYDVYVEIYGPDGAQLISQACNLKLSGHSSRENYAQKAFRLKARSEYGDNRFRAKLFSGRDYTAFKAVTLRASGQDNQETHIRDSVLTALAADTGVMYLESEVAVVYVDGVYWGLYNLRERVTADSVAQFEGWDSPDGTVIVRNGEREEGSLSGYNSLMSWIAEADLTVQESLDSLGTYVDVENYLDYVALEMYTCNLDLSNVRCYCNPAAEGRWKWILYDLDLSYRVDRNMARDWLIPGGVGTITQQDNTLFVKLMENAQLRDAFLSRMGQLLRTTFSAENVISRFKARRDLIAPEMAANCARWGWSVDKWRGECDKFESYAITRPARLVEYLGMAFELSEEESLAYFAGIE
ncbi:MAG: CotH kinase family protein [Clostridia bacterium]|nr:CotH kinase family protein [Clostridia bacterium]